MLAEINIVPTNSYLEITKDNNSIALRTWGSHSDCKAVCLLVHGLGAHSGWFEPLARLLKVQGIFCASFDLLGFGKRRQHQFVSYSQWLDDVQKTYDYLRQLLPEKPIYILGNSMGALLVLAALQEIKPNGIILCSPGLNGNPKTFTLFYKLQAIVRALLNPEAGIALPYSLDLVVQDKNVEAWLQADTDRRFTVSGKMALELLKLTKYVEYNIPSCPVPLLLMTAGKDYIVDNERNNFYFFNQLKIANKKSLHFADSFHDLLLDPRVDEVATEIVSWLKELALNSVIRP